MIETEYIAPPDLMNRFVDTPVNARLAHNGVGVVVKTNDDSFGAVPLVRNAMVKS